MIRPGRVRKIAGIVGASASIAAGVWLFRYGILSGLVGLNLAKHVSVAILCQNLGAGKRPPGQRSAFGAAHTSIPRPHSLAKDARR